MSERGRWNFHGKRDGNGNTIGLRGSPFTVARAAARSLRGRILLLSPSNRLESARFLDPGNIPALSHGVQKGKILRSLILNTHTDTDTRTYKYIYVVLGKRKASTNQAREWRTCLALREQFKPQSPLLNALEKVDTLDTFYAKICNDVPNFVKLLMALQK